ncbi:MAG: AMP-binding protein [Polyangiaceae bacterium]|nr:AMP-binding protein [Polyangiaceae bacterium]MCL4748719.1 AMP-binding protein [Myxococcales bacterium]
MDELRLTPGFSLSLGERTLTGTELAARARLIVSSLPQGRPIAFVARVDEPTLVLSLALFDAGIPFLPLHPRASEVERELLVRRANAVRVEPSALEPSAAALPPSGEETAALVATSGSTAEPKLVALPRRAFLASARASAANLPLRPSDRWLLCLPFAHVGGLSILTRCLMAGSGVVAHPGFEPEALLELCERQRVSVLSAVPAMLGPLFSADGHGRLGRLRALLVGGAGCPSELRREACARRVPLLTSYGLTETCSQIATQRPGDAHDPESLDSGQALPGAELRVQDGVLEVRGPMLANGYLGEPFAPDAFFRTGDLGEIDAAGRVYVHGRADDVLLCGGENVHPESVERALRAQPGVRDALVFGAPDPRFGQVVAALLVLTPGLDPEPALRRVLEGAAGSLSSFARPRRIACVAALPANALGKPDRRRAARELASALKPC